MRRALCACLIAASCHAAETQPIRRVPPPGVQIPDKDRADLATKLEALAKRIASAKTSLITRPQALAQLPDVQVFHKAVDWALRHDEFFDPKQVAIAEKMLDIGRDRAEAFAAGKTPWDASTGLVVRAYCSKIDGSVQPYGMVVPGDWKPGDTKPRPLHFWCHGRGEKLSELDFLNQRMTNPGEFTPPGAFVLHLYGRYCCANKFAGEVDLFEALEDARRHYPIDVDRLVVRGFSMGGASAWQFATHFASRWAAAAPGAGFAESKEFLKLGSAPDKPLPPEWEQTLWRWYDSTLYAANLANCTTVAYSGENDGQKQAADIMIRHLAEEGLTIPHIIGPATGHKYHPDAKPQIEEIVSAAVQKGRDPEPKRVRFTTYTLVYPRMAWVEVEGLARHWDRADVTAEITADRIVATTRNVTALRLDPPSGHVAIKKVVIDGQEMPATWAKDGARFHAEKGRWAPGPTSSPKGALRKRPGLCGPIDHAFMDSFIFVTPTGRSTNKALEDWSKAELDRAIAQWRQVFRGDARITRDTSVTPADIAGSNLVLWGDPNSNAIIRRILDKLPLKWDIRGVSLGGQSFDVKHHAPVLIFPNPLNPERYVVINSGFTFREAAALNNAQQTPKLPDWAIVDLRTPPDAYWPGKIAAAGFFDESWRPVAR
ncbi:MAG: hypothetical protein IT577_13600 [Verrucomicrobiae bacterium]|nr:hypothetical protein [Verrucomicrobiae bacterium]